MTNSPKLPLDHVFGLFSEAKRLHEEALRHIESDEQGGLERATQLLANAQLLADDVASYALPNGLKLSVNAFLAALDKQLISIDATYRR